MKKWLKVILAVLLLLIGTYNICSNIYKLDSQQNFAKELHDKLVNIAPVRIGACTNGTTFVTYSSKLDQATISRIKKTTGEFEEKWFGFYHPVIQFDPIDNFPTKFDDVHDTLSPQNNKPITKKENR